MVFYIDAAHFVPVLYISAQERRGLAPAAASVTARAVMLIQKAVECRLQPERPRSTIRLKESVTVTVSALSRQLYLIQCM
jgi:hypothetical protein